VWSNVVKDFRYTFTNAPIQWLGLEDIFKGLALQRLYTGIAKNSIRASQEDYMRYGMTPLGPRRSDGYVNPIFRYIYSHV
jgi:hypothetical protein